MRVHLLREYHHDSIIDLLAEIHAYYAEGAPVKATNAAGIALPTISRPIKTPDQT